MSNVQIYYNGTPITNFVSLKEARFSTQVNGTPGNCSFRVKDTNHDMTFVVGKPLKLTIDGDNIWDGYVATVQRSYAFDAYNTANSIARYLVITGVDLNVLFRKRDVFSQTTPTNTYGVTYTVGTADTVAINDLVTDWLDLSGDSIDTSSGIVGVGDINIDQPANPFGAGFTWGQAMAAIMSVNGGIFYINPDRVLITADVDVPTAPHVLSDTPSGGQVGYREFSLLYDGNSLVNEVYAWGAGGGSPTPVVKHQTDATSIAAHGTWQYGRIYSGVYKQATLDKIVNSVINGSPLSHRGQKDDRVSVTLSTFTPGFRAGQVTTIYSNTYGWTDALPIRRLDISFVGPTEPKYTLTCSHDIDQSFEGLFDVLPFPDFDFNGKDHHFKPYKPPVLDPQRPTSGGCECGVTDTFTRTVTDNWGTSDSGISWDDPYGGFGDVTGGEGHIAIAGNIRKVLLIGQVIDNAFVSARTVAAAGGDSFFVVFDNDPDIGFEFYGNGDVILYANAVTSTTTLGFGSNTAFNSRIVVTSDTTWALYLWTIGSTEPSTPTATLTDATGGFLSASTAFSVGGVGTSFDAYVTEVDITGLDRCSENRFDNFDRPINTSAWGRPTSNAGFAWNDFGNATVGTSGGFGYADLTSSTFMQEIWQDIGNTALPWSGEFTMTLDFIHDGIDSGKYVEFFVAVIDNNTDEASNAFVYLPDNGDTPEVSTAVAQLGGPPAASDGGTITNPAAGVRSHLKWHFAPGSTSQVKFWSDPDPEPDWQATASAGAATTSHDKRIYVSADSDYTVHVDFDNLDFGYAGKSCYEDCGDLSVFDAFSRTVAPGSWGSASSGPTYTRGGGSNGLSYVTPGAGVMQNAGGPTGISETQTVDFGIVPGSDFRVEVSAGLSSDTAIHSVEFAVDQASYVCGWDHDPGGDARLFLQGAGGAGRTTVPFSNTFWAGVSNVAIFKMQRSGGTLYFKLWDSDATEPGWQIAIAAGGAGSPGVPDQIECLMVTSDTVGGQQAAFTEIKVGDPCTDVPPTEGAVTGGGFVGGVSETAVRVDSTHYTVSSEILPGTAEVHVDGTLVPSTDYTVSTTDAEITFTSPVGSSSVVTVNYEAIGPTSVPPVSSGVGYPPDVPSTSLPSSAGTIPSLPTYLVPITDATFGTRVTRVSNTAGQRHAYAVIPAWSFDGSKILLGFQAPYAVLDGHDYSVIRTTSTLLGNASWSSLDNNKIFGTYDSDNHFYSQNMTTDSQTPLHTFSGYSGVSLGDGEGHVDDNDRYVALMTDGPEGILVYDIIGDSIVAWSAITGANNCTISRLGNYVLANFNLDGSGVSHGVWRYNRNLTGGVQISTTGGNHCDAGLDASGREIYVQIDGSIKSYDLASGAVTTLLPSGTAFGSGHVSCRNLSRPGWAYLSVYDYPGTSGQPGRDQVIGVKTDGSRTVEIFAYSNNRTSTYNAQPQASVSPNGKQVIFASAWGASDIFAYVAEQA